MWLSGPVQAVDCGDGCRCHSATAILAPDQIEPWLDARTTDAASAVALCRPSPDDWLRLDPVSARVNDARNDDPGLIEPVGRPQAGSPERAAPPEDRPRSSDEDGQGRLL